jgi:predicted transcriptional regulator YheO
LTINKFFNNKIFVELSRRANISMTNKGICNKDKKKNPTVRGSVDNFLENLCLVVEGISNIFGKHCEVVLHDLRHPEQSIVAIANGHVTGRKIGAPVIGGPVDDEGLKTILDKAETQSVIGNYQSFTRDGRPLKSTTVIFRNTKGIPIVALCINLELTDVIGTKGILDELCAIESKSEKGGVELEKSESSPEDITAIVKSIIDEATESLQKPIHLSEKSDKVNAVKTMHDRGLFLLKGGVEYAAKGLGVTRFTIYNYLKEYKYSR